MGYGTGQGLLFLLTEEIGVQRGHMTSSVSLGLLVALVKLELGSSGISLDASLETYLLWQFNSQRLRAVGPAALKAIPCLHPPPRDWAQ